MKKFEESWRGATSVLARLHGVVRSTAETFRAGTACARLGSSRARRLRERENGAPRHFSGGKRPRTRGRTKDMVVGHSTSARELPQLSSSTTARLQPITAMSIRIARSALRPLTQSLRISPGLRWNSTAAPEIEQLSEGEQHIVDKLTAKFQPSKLQVQDVSGGCSPIYSRTHGTDKSPGGCGTFYAISIKSSAFAGLSTLKQHRLVTSHLKDEVANIHGLQVRLVSPSPRVHCGLINTLLSAQDPS